MSYNYNIAVTNIKCGVIFMLKIVANSIFIAELTNYQITVHKVEHLKLLLQDSTKNSFIYDGTVRTLSIENGSSEYFTRENHVINRAIRKGTEALSLSTTNKLLQLP